MSNWVSITADTLKASGHGLIVDKARTVATGAVDPVIENIADAVARVRAACSTGNQMNQDPSTVPNSLKGLTVRLALFALMERIGLGLSEDQRDTRRNDNSYLLRINDDKLRFEAPDVPAGSAEMQRGNTIGVVNKRRRETGREKCRGL